MNNDSPELKPRAFKDRNAAEAYLSHVAPSVKNVAFSRHVDDYQFDYAGGTIGSCSLHRGEHTGMSFDIEESGEFHLLLPIKASVAFDVGNVTIEAAQQRSALLITPESKGRVHTSAPCAGISLFASASAIAEQAEKIVEPGTRIVLDRVTARSVSVSDPAIEALTRNTVAVFHEMMTLGRSGLTSVARANFDDLLLGLFAASVSNRVRAELLSTKGANDTIVRRAQEFIRAHHANAIRLSDLARTLGVGLRGLQIAFQRQLGCSPREYLMRCRLEASREALLSAKDDAKVSAIALEAGFADLAHFSRTYRNAYGELPSETLKRRK